MIPYLTETLIEPLSFLISPRIAEIKEDLPTPTGPTMASNEPAGTSKFILKGS